MTFQHHCSFKLFGSSSRRPSYTAAWKPLPIATTIHNQLKSHYVQDTSRHEVDLDGYRIDAIDSDDRLIEIQCASLLAIRDKIRNLTCNHSVVVVKPLAARKKLIKKAKLNGKTVSSRYSPAKQTLAWIFQELVHFTKAFPHPNLQLDVLLTEQEEIRLPPKTKSWRRKHSVHDRTLVEVQHTYSLQTVEDLWMALEVTVPDVFTRLTLPREEKCRVGSLKKRPTVFEK